MKFDPENPVVKLCAEGIQHETQTGTSAALTYYTQAWEIAGSIEEKYIAAHYMARQQATVQEKLHWDQVALRHALLVDDQADKSHLPSLYLNIAKCYEDLKEFDKAKMNYQLALSYSNCLPEDGYGQLILNGIKNGLERLAGN